MTDRYRFQECFAGDLARVGQSDLASPYTLILGDEYQLDITERAIHKYIRDARLHDWVELIGQAETKIEQCLH